MTDGRDCRETEAVPGLSLYYAEPHVLTIDDDLPLVYPPGYPTAYTPDMTRRFGTNATWDKSLNMNSDSDELEATLGKTRGLSLPCRI